ncbi:MAG: DNA-directed RNA polymerase subunit beta [Candidatus Latescibacteria bacterium]|nr:DNA-directed RNA polymerase subunit beta [Candidatus Latescibacterota bacterium]
MWSSVDDNKVRTRRDYSKLPTVIEMPNLLAVQIESYRAFLQADVPPAKRKSQGLQAVFNDVFPISDIHEKFSLEFIEYMLGEPKYSIRECQERGMTYAIPLKAKLRLVIREDTEEGKKVKDIIEQVVYLGELPLITDKGTFIINGAERVIVSQLHRSPGVFFSEETHPNGKHLYSARIIPNHGAWVEFSLDVNDVLYVHVERKRKLPVTILLRALGYATNEQIYTLFYETEHIKMKNIAGMVGRTIASPIVDSKTGEVLAEVGEKLTEEGLERLSTGNGRLGSITVLKIDPAKDPEIIFNTLKRDPTRTTEEALFRLYNLLRPGDPPNVDTAKALLDRMFFNPKRYDLGAVGRHRINKRLGLDIPMTDTTLTNIDFVEIIRYLIGLRSGQGDTDDIDHLGNRRTRSVGELLAGQFNIGLTRMARTIRERISLHDVESITPQDLVNARTVSSVIAAFFGSSQLSQFMEQTNPLAELTHKRRLSSLGPGGLDRAHASFEVRDVHHTHYGRICPIETPEGPNIGLIAYLSTYARVNEYGFIETPYRKVDKGRVTDKIEYLSADLEEKFTIAQANSPVDKRGRLIGPVKARRKGDFPVVSPDEIDYMDVSPKQLVGISAALIPFLEHDDANRALMGSNMQRQSVPLLVTEAPLIGTGLEGKVAIDSGAVTVARRAGTVQHVSADMIIVAPDTDEKETPLFDAPVDMYHLIKFKKSNQETCINQHPVVMAGDRVEVGQVLADGPATCDGELALGRNVLVAFMSWEGYNFEDAIVVSENLVKQDTFTSIHITEFELPVRETKVGVEELTREIPNVSEDAVRNLDENGVIRIGAEIGPGDILVGKVTPKGERELSPEERLLRAIFGEKAGDVRDASLKAPPGMSGIVIDTRIFSRKDRDEVTKEKERQTISELKRDYDQRIVKIRSMRNAKLRELLAGQVCAELRDDEDNHVVVPARKKFNKDLLGALEIDRLCQNQQWVEDESVNEKIHHVIDSSLRNITVLERQLEREIEKVIRGDELAPGVIQLVKVYIAKKRKLAVGDKMAGRHGNKGVVAKIVPEEDMPYLPDGTPIDIILNPLGVPGRMNLGQILETHLGWAAKKLGLAVASPVFDGATIEETKATLENAGLPESGKTVLYDGKTGLPFDKEVTVGYMYKMKLSHLVDDKIHARSIGPYSLVTQQPLGGKAQFGGQRFGEMEVWALEAYGAAYILQEMLTVKSDDVNGRSKLYEAIVKGDNPPEPGIPESFNVLVKELQSLALDVQLEE